MQSYPIYCAICGAANESDQEDCFACQSALAVPSPSAEPEPLLHGRYRLQRQLGVGGFGAVYQARDELKPDVPIVIKQINLRDLTARQIIEATETFQRERVILSALNHPRLPRLHETFEDQEHWYLVLSYFPGKTLEQYLLSQNWQHGTSEPERSRVEELLHCGLQLCEVLSYLHTRLPVVIFRDLKPGNIIRGPDGSYALIDFGIARTVKAGQLRDTIPLGSPGYAAPEQYGRAQTDERADIYSLGAILHQMLSGYDPSEQPLSFAPFNFLDPVLKRLEALILSMVSLSVDRRPTNIKAVSRELSRIEDAYQQSGGRIWVPGPSQRSPWLVSSEQDGLSSALTPTIGGGQGQQQIFVQPRSIPARPNSATNWKRRALLLAGMGLAIGGTLTGKTIISQFLPDSSAVSSPQQAIRVPTQSNGVLQQGDKNLIEIAWSPGGRYLATIVQTTADTNMLAIWDAVLKRQIWSSDLQASEQSFAWSPDGSRFALALDNMVEIWSVSRPRPVMEQRIPHAKPRRVAMPVNAVLWSPDGNYLAFTVDWEVRIWHLQNRAVTVNYRAHTAEKISVPSNRQTVGVYLLWSPDGTSIASTLGGAWGSSLRIWNITDGKTLVNLQDLNAVNWMQWSPNSAHLFFGLTGDFMSAYDLRSGQILLHNPFVYPSVSRPGMPLAGWSPDGSRLVQAVTTQPPLSSSGNIPDQIGAVRIQITNFPALHEITSWTAPAAMGLIGLIWSRDGRYIIAAYNDTQNNQHGAAIYYPANGKLLGSISTPGIVWSMAFSPDGHFLLICWQDPATLQLALGLYLLSQG